MLTKFIEMISIEQLLDSFFGDQMARKLQDNQRYADIHAFSCGYGSWQKDHKFVYCCMLARVGVTRFLLSKPSARSDSTLANILDLGHRDHGKL